MVKRSDYKSEMPVVIKDEFVSSVADPALVTDHQIKERWWLEFEDDILNEIIKDAEINNRNVEIARQNLIKSRFAITLAAMGIFPTGGLNYNYYMFKNPMFGPGIDLKLFQAGFDAKWELDIWGKTLDEMSAAKFRSLKMMENHSNVLLSLYAEISKNYIKLRKMQSLKQNSNQKIEKFQKIIDLRQKSLEIGIITNTELLQAKLNIENETIKLIELDSQIKSLILSISVLTGNLPEKLIEKLEQSKKPFDTYKSEVVPIGIRSDLLKRRPDVKMAEYELEAIIDDSSVSSKQLLPSFQLGGSFLFSSKAALGVFTGPLVTNLTVGPKFPIFQLGSLISQYRMSKVDAKIAMFQYEQVILDALKDTEIALTNYINNVKSEYRRKLYLENAQEIYNQKNKMKQIGNINEIDFINAEIVFLESKDLFLDSKEKTLISLIVLHKELGGGFDMDVEIDGDKVNYIERKKEDLEKYNQNAKELTVKEIDKDEGKVS